MGKRGVKGEGRGEEEKEGGKGREYSLLHTEVDFCVHVCMLTTQHKQDSMNIR